MTPEEAKQNIKKLATTYRRLFETPNGMKVLLDLESEFEPDKLMGNNDAQTNYNVGKRDVVRYIKQMIRIGDNVQN